MTFPPQPPPAPGHGGQPQPPPNKPWVWIIVGVSVLAIVALGITFGVTYLNKSTTTTATSATTRPIPPSTSSPAASGGNRQQLPKRPTPLANPIGCEYTATPNSPAAKQATKPADGNVPSTGKATVTFKTNAGTIGLDLDRALAPCTVNSFVSLARQGYYTGTSCHRLSVEGLQMLQCGDPTGKGTGGPGYAFDDEVFPELQYGRGILAMANAGPGTNGSQFFMVFGEAPLPPSYTVFGSISDEGLTMLDKVAAAGVDPASAAESPDGTGAPVLPVQFTEVSVGS